MDAATIKGVIDRLTKRGVTVTTADPADGRRLMVALTAEGEAIYERGKPMAERITAATLEPLSAAEQETFVALLRRLG
jgi:MarR family transcriptional regulator, lower aerobic nicotinate degradation pathway regulator